jgi:hypothetical protein
MGVRFRPQGEIHEWWRNAKFAAVAWALAIDLLGTTQTAIEELTNRCIRRSRPKGAGENPTLTPAHDLSVNEHVAAFCQGLGEDISTPVLLRHDERASVAARAVLRGALHREHVGSGRREGNCSFRG